MWLYALVANTVMSRRNYKRIRVHVYAKKIPKVEQIKKGGIAPMGILTFALSAKRSTVVSGSYPSAQLKSSFATRLMKQRVKPKTTPNYYLDITVYSVGPGTSLTINFGHSGIFQFFPMVFDF